jgi:hypothetical protein
VRHLRPKKAERGQNEKAIEAEVAGEAALSRARVEYRPQTRLFGNESPDKLNRNLLFQL